MKQVKNSTVVKQKLPQKTFFVLIAMAIVLIATIAIFIGCTNFSADEPIEVQLEKALQTVLDVAMSGEENTETFLFESESRTSFEVLSYAETDNGVLVTCLVHAPDLYTIVKEIDENYTFETDAELNDALVTAIGNAQIIDREVTIEFKKNDDGYEPLLNIEFIDAYYGGILKLYNETLTKQQTEVE